MTFCKLEGALEMVDLEGGPSGGKGLDDMDVLVGLVIAEELLLPPWFELRPELTDDGLDRVPDPLEVCLAALVTCLDVPCGLGREVCVVSVFVKVKVKNFSSSISQTVMIILAKMCLPVGRWSARAKQAGDIFSWLMMTSTTASCTVERSLFVLDHLLFGSALSAVGVTSPSLNSDSG